MLRYAQREVTKLRRDTDTSDITTVDLVLIFDRSEEEMKRLVGYPAFAKALEELGGEHTEANIQEACCISHFSRGSVYFDDIDNGEQIPDYHIPIRCKKALARKAINSNRNTKHNHISLD